MESGMIYRWKLLALLCLLSGCSTLRDADAGRAEEGAVRHRLATSVEDRGRATGSAPSASMSCALKALDRMASSQRAVALQASTEAAECTKAWLNTVGRAHPQWQQGTTTVAGTTVEVVLRDASPNLATNFRIIPSDQVPMHMYWGARKTRSGFGVPVVLLSERCSGRPVCSLLPPSGVARSATAWLEPSADGGAPRLVLGHAVRTKGVYTGYNFWPLAEDSSAFYAAALGHSPIRRLSIWNLLGGREMGRRAGVYLLEDYDPNKRTLVMIHGLGSSPVTWARLSNAIWADPQLRANYQIWQVVYETNEPILIGRHRVERYLDKAWETLDPQGTAPARRNIVLLGHSMGGAISRLLMVQSHDKVWRAAFNAPVSALRGNTEDIRALDGMFRLAPYPGVKRGIFLASPHQGSPTAGSFLGRVADRLVGRRSPELAALRRVAIQNEGAVPAGLKDHFLRGNINSITTLRSDQPVMAAARELQIVDCTPFHTIAGHKAGSSPPGDGVVPLESAILPGATSNLVIESSHNVHEHDAAITEVLRILHREIEDNGDVRGIEPLSPGVHPQLESQ